MLIRCERCSTLYELDEALLSPTGSQVQCTKCQHVFTALPSGGAGRAIVGDAPEPEAAPTARREERPASPVEEARAPSAPTAPAGPRAEARVARSGPPPVYRPPTPAMGAATGGAVGRSPVLRRDAVGSFEARLRWSARWRWLGPTLVALALVGAAAGWFLFGRESDPYSATRGETLSLVARDDAASLDEALARLDDAVRRPAARRDAAADRALAQVMRAAIVLEDGEVLAARRAALLSERERLRREQPAGWEDAERAASEGARALESQARVLEEQARMLGATAFEALRVLQSEVGDTPEVERGIAAYHALGGDRVRAEKTIRAARNRQAPDPWLALVEGWVDASAADRPVRERGVAQLAALASANPELLRGRYLLARAQASLGGRSDALATVERLLADNPRHAGAMRLREELAEREEPSRAEEREPPAAPAVPVEAAPPRPEARPERKPVAAPRKIVSSPPPGSPAPAEAPVPAETPPPVSAAPAPAPEAVAIPEPPPAPASPGPVDATAAPAPRARRPPIQEQELLPPGDGG